jgi:hypothetical protein
MTLLPAQRNLQKLTYPVQSRFKLLSVFFNSGKINWRFKGLGALMAAQSEREIAPLSRADSLCLAKILYLYDPHCDLTDLTDYIPAPDMGTDESHRSWGR